MNINQKGFANIVLVVVIVILVGVVGYFIFVKKPEPIAQQPTPTQTTTPTKTPVSPTLTPTPKDETANWKSYSYPQFGYSFKIPATYFLRVNALNDPTVPFILQSLSTSVNSNTESGKNDFGFFVESASSLQDGINKINHPIAGDPTNYITNEQQVTIGGRQWTSFNLGSLGEIQYVIYVNNKLYVVGGSGTISDLLKQVASTYKFTN